MSTIVIHAEQVLIAGYDDSEDLEPVGDLAAELMALHDELSGGLHAQGFLDVLAAVRELALAWRAKPIDVQRLWAAFIALRDAITGNKSGVQAFGDGAFWRRLIAILEKFGPTLWPILIGLL